MKASSERVETIRACYARGRGGLTEAARLLGMKKQHVWRIAMRLGLTTPRRSPNTLAPHRRAAVLQLAREGYSDYAIHEATGIARSTVIRLRRDAGIAPHSQDGGRGSKKRVPRNHAARVSAGVQPRAASPAPDIRSYWLSTDKSLRSA